MTMLEFRTRRPLRILKSTGKFAGAYGISTIAIKQGRFEDRLVVPLLFLLNGDPLEGRPSSIWSREEGHLHPCVPHYEKCA